MTCTSVFVGAGSVGHNAMDRIETGCFIISVVVMGHQCEHLYEKAQKHHHREVPTIPKYIHAAQNYKILSLLKNL